MRTTLAFLAVAALAVPTVAAGSGARQGAKPAMRVVISTRKLPTLGYVLIDGRGRTLYMFVPDKRKRVTCVRVCAAVWPPVKLAPGGKVVARGRVKANLLGSDRNPAGGRVVTYAGWPLYTYVSDTRAGIATGQALNLNGGLWYVLAPSGRVIRTKVR